MSISQLTLESLLRSPETWLMRARLADFGRGQSNLEKLAHCGMTIDLLESMFGQLEHILPLVSDPDMALNNFERFVAAARSPIALGALFERDPTAIEILLRIFSNSQHLADLLVRDREAYDALRMSEGQPITLDRLNDDLASEMRSATEARQAMSILRRFKNRETLRVAFGDVIVQQRLGVVCEQVSAVAQAICQCAYEFCRHQLIAKWGVPRNADGQEIRGTVFALGKFGGNELNYSSDIDLIFVYGENGKCDGPRSRSALEFFEDLTRDFTKLLTESTRHGFCYRVDHRLRPDGSKGRLVNTCERLTQYLENQGRTWERQAWIKARPVAGDLHLGRSILKTIEPWIFRSHLNRFEITGVKALKRQIEKRTIADGLEHLDIKTGHGGIRDIEFVIQFMQLLNGGRLPEVRTVNTLKAIERLQRAGCLSLNEETLLSQNYIWLRRLEHRLQIMHDLQTHSLPVDRNERRKIAIRMGYADVFGLSALEQFQNDLQNTTDMNRRILDHLLHTAFSEFPDEEVPPVVDLIFKTEPTDDEKRFVMQEFAFSDPIAAANNFMSCAIETIPFLSQQRCRHFFAAIAPRLLREIRQTPAPDATLVSLRSVADHLGAKGVLWELFATASPAMELFVRLCASADYLTSILRDHPGMIDELVDALLVEDLPPGSWLRATLKSLLEGATELDPILHAFKQAQHLRVGVRDLMGHVNSDDVNRTLSNIADICLETVASFCFEKLIPKFGRPMIEHSGKPVECQYAVVACGKLAGSELNYQSDLDLIFLFESDGQTVAQDRARQTTNQHFFSQWAAEVTKFVTTAGRYGKLFEIDSRLRPSGKSGSLATSLEALRRYFESGVGQSWERLVLCKSRVVVAGERMLPKTEAEIRQAIVSGGFSRETVREIREMRLRMQADTTPKNLKRGPGGTVDVEFLTQLLQLKHVLTQPSLRIPETVRSLRRQADLGLIKTEHADELIAGYVMLRRVESALRLSSATPRSEMDDDDLLVRSVKYLMRMPPEEDLLRRIASIQKRNRELFDEYTQSLE